MRSSFRKLLFMVCVVPVLFLSGCASLQKHPAGEKQLAGVCFPGSAIRRPVQNPDRYPAWMVRERGNCLHNR